MSLQSSLSTEWMTHVNLFVRSMLSQKEMHLIPLYVYYALYKIYTARNDGRIDVTTPPQIIPTPHDILSGMTISCCDVYMCVSGGKLVVQVGGIGSSLSVTVTCGCKFIASPP